MKATLPGCTLAALMVSLFAALSGISAAASVPGSPGPLLAISLENSPVDKHFEPVEDTGIWSRGWVKGLLFGIGGFSAGLAGPVLLHALRKRPAGKGRAGLWAVPLLLAAMIPRAGACINVEEGTLEKTYLDLTDTGWFTGTVRNAMKADPATDPHLRPNPSAYAFPPAPGVLECDEAARMIIRGDSAGALVRLQEIERKYPGLYQTAANMGTAYELTGNDEKALQWIRTGIRRNPHSHMNAEWLHVKILEAKIALKKDPRWLESHTLTGLNPNESSGYYETLQGGKSRREVLESMRSQATVRALFIKPLDLILAHLLKEAALFAIEADTGSAAGLVDLAETYGLPPAAAAGARNSLEQRLAGAPRPQFQTVFAAWVGLHWHWLVGGGCVIAGIRAGSAWNRRRAAPGSGA